MNTKSKITKKILMDTILPEEAIHIIIDKLNENEDKLDNIGYLLRKKLTFGKHIGKTLGYVARNKPYYIDWLYNNEINPHNNLPRKMLRRVYYVAQDNKNNQYIPNLRF